MMHVKLEELEAAFMFIDRINSADLKDIVWTRDGRPYKTPVEDVIEDWKWVGLSNKDFPFYAGMMTHYNEEAK